MTLQTVLLFLGGVLYGMVVGFLGQKIINSTAVKAAPRNDKEAQKMARKIMGRWWLKLAVDALALFVLFKVIPMMLGAALGIYVMQKILIIRLIKHG